MQGFYVKGFFWRVAPALLVASVLAGLGLAMAAKGVTLGDVVADVIRLHRETHRGWPPPEASREPPHESVAEPLPDSTPDSTTGDRFQALVLDHNRIWVRAMSAEARVRRLQQERDGRVPIIAATPVRLEAWPSDGASTLASTWETHWRRSARAVPRAAKRSPARNAGRLCPPKSRTKPQITPRGG